MVKTSQRQEEGGACVSEGRGGPVGSSLAPGLGLAFPGMPGGCSSHVLSPLLSVVCHLPFDSRPLCCLFRGFPEQTCCGTWLSRRGRLVCREQHGTQHADEPLKQPLYCPEQVRDLEK